MFANAERKENSSIFAFVVFWLIILCVAGYDVYCSIHLQEVLPQTELNPIGGWLISLDQGSIALFMSFKFIGTVIALNLLFILFLLCARIGIVVSGVLALFSAFLFLYLIFV